jgi:hypothetical protein
MRRIRWPRPTVRLRLALTYTALFVVTGVALLGVSYVLSSNGKKGPAPPLRSSASAASPVRPAGAISGVVTGPPPEALQISPAACAGVVGTFYSHSSSSSSGSSFFRRRGGARAGLRRQQDQIPGPTAAAIEQLTAAVTASQDAHPRQLQDRLGDRSRAHHHPVIRPVMVDGRAGPPARAPHHRRGPPALRTDPAQPDQPPKAPTTSSKN